MTEGENKRSQAGIPADPVEEIYFVMTASSETERAEARLYQQPVRTRRKETNKENGMANLYNENAPTYGGSPGTNALSAFFDSRSDAESAVQKLKDAGIPDEKVRFVPGYESDEARNNVASDDRGGFWHMLSSFFLADDDRETYAEGLRRGGYLVSVSDINDADYETAHDILDDDGAIDIDERADQWRTEGWSSPGGLASSTYDRNASTEVGVPSTARTEDTFDAGLGNRLGDDKLQFGRRDASNRVRAYSMGTPAATQSQFRSDGLSYSPSEIREHAEVVGSDGRHVGTVDHIYGERIKLTKTDSRDGQHHFLGLDTVASVDGNRVKLAMPADEAIARSTLQ